MGNPNCCFMIIAETFFFFSQSLRGTVKCLFQSFLRSLRQPKEINWSKFRNWGPKFFFDIIFYHYLSLLLCVKSKVSNFWYRNTMFWAISANLNHYFGLFTIQSFTNFTWDVLQWAELGLPLLLLLADVSEKRRFRVPPLNIAFTSSHAYTIT